MNAQKDRKYPSIDNSRGSLNRSYDRKTVITGNVHQVPAPRLNADLCTQRHARSPQARIEVRGAETMIFLPLGRTAVRNAVPVSI